MLYCVCVWRSTLQDKPTLHRPLSLICRSRGTKRGQSTNKKKHSRTKHARTQAVPAKNSHPQRQAITDGSLPARALRCTTTHLQGRLSPSPYLHRHLRLPSLSHTNTHHLRHHHRHRHRPQSEPPTTNRDQGKKRRGDVSLSLRIMPNSTHSDSHLHACRRVVVFKPCLSAHVAADNDVAAEDRA